MGVLVWWIHEFTDLRDFIGVYSKEEGGREITQNMAKSVSCLKLTTLPH